MEYRILTLFIRHPNTFFTANELYRKIWGKESLGDVRTVQVHIHNLRSKIEPDPAKPIYLKNVWGKGYIFPPGRETEQNGFAVLNIVNPQSTHFLRKQAVGAFFCSDLTVIYQTKWKTEISQRRNGKDA